MTNGMEPMAVQRLTCPGLPLAVYQEVAAHLGQVNGVDVELLPQLAETFDYRQSQVGGIAVRYTSAAAATAPKRIQQILAYYGDRHGSWQPLDS